MSIEDVTLEIADAIRSHLMKDGSLYNIEELIRSKLECHFSNGVSKDELQKLALRFAHTVEAYGGCLCEHNKADSGCPIPCVACQARTFIKNNSEKYICAICETEISVELCPPSPEGICPACRG
jgi:hypothetical protein